MPQQLDVNQVGASSATAAAANTASIPALAGNRAYCTGIEIICDGATAATEVTATLTGCTVGTKNWAINVPLGVNITGPAIRESYNPPLKASAVNAAITLTLPSPGAGNVGASCSIEGFYLPEP